jgi:hypothetical protein
MAEDRAWMYNEWSRNRRHSNDWVAKNKDFVDHVFSLSLTGNIGCPCRWHENIIFLNKERVSLDLCQFGFMARYEVREHHGEVVLNPNVEEENNDWAGDDALHEMLDSLRTELNLSSEDPATLEVSKFIKLLKDSEEPFHEHTEVSILAFVTRLMAIKYKYFFFLNNYYNEILKLLKDVLPKPNKLPKDMYHSKTIIKGLGMDYEKIDV